MEWSLTVLLQHEIVVALKSLMEATGEDAGKLKQIENYVKSLRQGVQVTSLSREVQDQLSRLIKVPEAVARQVAIESFLKGLSFDGIYERFEMIRYSSHSQLFEWMWEEDDYPDPFNNSFYFIHPEIRIRLGAEAENLDRRRYRKLFADWLSSGEGIFHISAKLGAGKSTLLRQLCTLSKINKHHLSGWAGTGRT